MASLFAPVDYKTLEPLSGAWKRALSLAIDAAWADSLQCYSIALEMGIPIAAFFDISEYHNNPNVQISATNTNWENAAKVLDKVLEV